MAIDLHCHWLPPTLVDAVRGREEPPRIRGDELEIVGTTLPFSPEYWSVERRLEHMDRHGIERQVVSLPGLFGVDSLPAAEAIPLARAFNDEAARLGTDHASRFSALAALPLDDVGAAVVELRRAVSELGLAGAILPAAGFTTLGRARVWSPVLREASDLGCHLFVHPGPLPSERSTPGTVHGDCAEERRVTLGTQASLTEVWVTLALTDVLDEHPGVTVQVANLGGAAPFLLDRMDHVSAVRHPDDPTPSARRRPVYVDCATFGPRGIRLAVEALGAEHVVFGSDHPIFGTGLALDAVREAEVEGSDREAILHGNAAGLLRREDAPS